MRAPNPQSPFAFVGADRVITALYIHVPFCRSACYYCDFVRKVCPSDDVLISAYLDRIVTELARLQALGALDQVVSAYIGGGTPTFLGPRLIPLAQAVQTACPQLASFTCEANPESTTHTLLQHLSAAGVNRISFGVQSFVDRELQAVGRIHSAEQAKERVASAKSQDFQVSVDLIAGLPHQTSSSFLDSLDTALNLSVDHISCYALTVEPQTPLATMVKQHQVKLPNEDEVADLLELASKHLDQAGFIRYETSNYARRTNQDNHEVSTTKPIDEHSCMLSIHNMTYWHIGSYLGLGPGAVSRLYRHEFEAFMVNQTAPSHRAKEVCDVLYLENLTDISAWISTEHPYGIQDSQPLFHRMIDHIVLALRTGQGVSHEYLEEAYEIAHVVDSPNKHLADRLSETMNALVDLGLIKRTSTHYVPTHRGWLLGNEIGVRLLMIAEDTSRSTKS